MVTSEIETASRVVVSRAFKASRHRVFRAWTDPELLMRWFIEPDGEMRVVTMDLRPGGAYRLEGKVGDRPWAIWGTYLPCAFEKLVYTWRWDNDPALGSRRATRRDRGVPGSRAEPSS